MCSLSQSAPTALRGAVALAVSSLLCAVTVHAADAPAPDQSSQPVQEVLVIGSTPIPGEAIDADKFPGNVLVLSAADLTRQGSASLTTALNSTLSSVNVNDDLDDPFQPDILFRGFEASPVLGTPQGLAVYQNGVRINEAFGDTVNWDLFPDIAINQAELVSSSPLYGLNALGGAVAVTMKNGFNYQGGDVELAGGSYDNRSTTGQFGMNSGIFGLYVAGKALDWDGWRDFSNDKIRSLFAVLSMHTDRVTVDLSYTRADDILNGQGSAPVQELAVSRALVFTGPQSNVNTLDFITLNGTLKLFRGWSMQGVAYYRDYAQSVSNGNTTHYASCDSLPGVLCQPDGVTPLTNADGRNLPDISDGGTLPIGENDFESIQAWGRGSSLQISDNESLWGHGNQLALGAAVDYAAASFYTGAQIGLLNAQLSVLPSDLIVDTPENSAAAIANGDPVPVSVDSVNKNLGTYVTDTFDVTPDFSVTASGRYNVARIDLADQLGTNLDGSNRFVHFNPAVGATYKIVAAMTLYGGISTNTRTPTASEIECSNPLTPCLLPTNLAGDPPNLRQVVSHTSELGLRGKISGFLGSTGALTWNVDVFRTLLHNDIYGIATSVSQGYFQNIGDTRRQGAETGFDYRTHRWSVFLNYSFVQATFQSALVVPSPSNPFQNALGDIQVEPGDRLPGIPEQRLKLGVDYEVISAWTAGATVNVVSGSYYAGDEANQLAPIPGYTVLELHSTYKLPHLEIFASIDNLLDRRYATWGILSDPTGIGAPGVPADGVTNGPGVDNRFLSPAAPFEVFGGVRLPL